MNMNMRYALSAALAVALLPMPALAAVSGIAGTTTDCVTGKAIPHARVVVRASRMTAPERHLYSDSAGRFIVLGLTPGRYYVAVEGTRSGTPYWGPHSVYLETNDVQHVLIGASNAQDVQCRPFALPHQQGSTDQTTLD